MANPSITFENCKIEYPNFSGAEGEMNEKGSRNFNIIIDENTVAYSDDGPVFCGIDPIVNMLRGIVAYDKNGVKYSQGANVKVKISDNGDEPPKYSLKINVGQYEPRNLYYFIGEKGKEKGKKSMTLETIGSLDGLRIDSVKVRTTFSPYNTRGNKGITNYLTDLIAWVKEDKFMKGYENIPDLSSAPVDYAVKNNSPSDMDNADDLPFVINN